MKTFWYWEAVFSIPKRRSLFNRSDELDISIVTWINLKCCVIKHYSTIKFYVQIKQIHKTNMYIYSGTKKYIRMMLIRRRERA